MDARITDLLRMKNKHKKDDRLSLKWLIAILWGAGCFAFGYFLGVAI